MHRLREVVALLGFTRIEPATKDVSDELDIGVQRADIARDISWLPACENRGEGVFVQFNEEALRNWQSRPEVCERAKMLYEGYKKWAGGDAVKLEKFPGPIYYMLHSFSHLLLTAISLECGYPASSLRERIFVSDGCGGILIYTGSSDAEGLLEDWCKPEGRFGATSAWRWKPGSFVRMTPFARITSIRFTTSSRLTGQLATAAF